MVNCILFHGPLHGCYTPNASTTEVPICVCPSRTLCNGVSRTWRVFDGHPLTLTCQRLMGYVVGIPYINKGFPIHKGYQFNREPAININPYMIRLMTMSTRRKTLESLDLIGSGSHWPFS